MPWIELFAVFGVSHLVGDFLLQTHWQATHKRGGLSSSRESTRALASHTVSYTLAFGPALIWLAADLGPAALAVSLMIAVPHAIQDDMRLLEAFALRVKHMQPSEYPTVMLLLDQSVHVVALFLTAIVVTV